RFGFCVFFSSCFFSFFFSSRRRHTRFSRDWSSDVCSSDLFLVNAGAPPLSAWLPDAYPEASWSGMVFLSAFTTKTAVYVLLRGRSEERRVGKECRCVW